MSDNVHPGSFVGDSVEEFKKLPVWGKALTAVVLLVVAYMGYRAYKSAGSGTSATSAAGTPSGTAGSSSPFPMVGNTPLLPSNINPVYDPSGSLTAYQSSPVTSSTVPPAPQGRAGVDYGLIPAGKYSGPSYSNLKSGTHYTYNGTSYQLSAGPQGKLYGTDPSGKQTLLYQPSSFYPGGTNYVAPGGTGSGPSNMLTFMEDPLLYLVSAKPHLPSTVPAGAK